MDRVPVLVSDSARLDLSSLKVGCRSAHVGHLLFDCLASGKAEQRFYRQLVDVISAQSKAHRQAHFGHQRAVILRRSGQHRVMCGGTLAAFALAG